MDKSSLSLYYYYTVWLWSFFTILYDLVDCTLVCYMIEKHANSRDLVLDQIVREKLVETEKKKQCNATDEYIVL